MVSEDKNSPVTLKTCLLPHCLNRVPKREKSYWVYNSASFKELEEFPGVDNRAFLALCGKLVLISAYLFPGASLWRFDSWLSSRSF